MRAAPGSFLKTMADTSSVRNDSNHGTPSAAEYPADDTIVPFIDLRQMMRTVLKNWKVMAIFAAIGALWALVSLHRTPYKYSAQMVVTAVHATDDTATARLSGLASLAGVNLRGSDSTAQFKLYLDSLASRDVADGLAQDPAFMHKLFAGQWDPKTQSWYRPPRPLRAAIISAIRSLLGFPSAAWHPPNGEDVQGYLSYALHINQDPREPYVATITMNTGNIPFAIETLKKINKIADEHLRRKALARTDQYIAYLTQQLKTVTVTEQRDAITNALSDQEKYAMMANAGGSFAAEMFDAPSASGFPISPRPIPTYLRGIFTWCVLGAIFVLVRNRYRAAIDRRLQAILARIDTEKLPRFMRRFAAATVRRLANGRHVTEQFNSAE